MEGRTNEEKNRIAIQKPTLLILFILMFFVDSVMVQIFAFIFAILCLIIPMIYNLLLFYPYRTEADGYENFMLTAGERIQKFDVDGTIECLFEDKGEETPIIISHGKAGNILARYQNFEIFNDSKYSLLMYDYAGFEKFIYKIQTIDQIVEDGESVLLHVREKFPNRKIILWGESIGSYVSCYLASQFDVDGLIIISGFADFGIAVNKVTGFPGLSYLLRLFVTVPNNLNLIKNVTCPLLVIHGMSDELFSEENPYRLFKEHGGTDKQLSLVKGGHFLDISLFCGIKSWIDSITK